MPHCGQCNRSDLADQWEFCPRCGGRLRTVPAGGSNSEPAKDVKEVLVGIALDAAQTFVKGRLQRKLAPVAQIIDQAMGPTTSVSGAQPPDWYAAAVAEQQPTMDPAELARLQADEITKARTATQVANMWMDHAKSMNSIISRGWD